MGKEMTSPADDFPTDIAGLPDASAPRVVELSHGDQFDLRISPVAKQLGSAKVRMLAYNGSVPGPTLRVRQGSELIIHAVNEGDLEATVHWHGLRLDNRYDGTAHTQAPMPVGGRFTYRLTFPDPGVYWYHPHIREDYGQEMGLYGNIIVLPTSSDYWPPANREVTLTLDDVLVVDGRLAPFSRSESSYTAMGRFGNVLLANGEVDPSSTAKHHEVVRFFLTDTANTRVFNVGIRGARMKRVGGDSGHYEREEFVDSVIIAPSERAVVDVLFDQVGEVVVEHRTPGRTYVIASILVSDETAVPELSASFDTLRTNADMQIVREQIAPDLEREPDKRLALVAEMEMGGPVVPSGATLVYYCPMHADVVQDKPGKCPVCGMKLLARAAEPTGFACPMHPEVRSAHADRCPKCGMKLVPSYPVPEATSSEHHHHPGGGGAQQASHSDATSPRRFPAGIEWEDDMVEVNRMTTPANMRWKLIDRASGAVGMAIDWRFRVGDRVKIRILNEMDSDHPMHHPFHIHGAGRFLILARDGVVEPNLVWKDTVLVPTGQTVDILLEVTNPGLWMAHCHIAEHHESGMMFNFAVEP
jgi:FtsP/CotA-like multicopper oxidase with cupredoxin domain